jgi:hypothetical protein
LLLSRLLRTVLYVKKRHRAGLHQAAGVQEPVSVNEASAEVVSAEVAGSVADRSEKNGKTAYKMGQKRYRLFKRPERDDSFAGVAQTPADGGARRSSDNTWDGEKSKSSGAGRGDGLK